MDKNKRKTLRHGSAFFCSILLLFLCGFAASGSPPVRHTLTTHAVSYTNHTSLIHSLPISQIQSLTQHQQPNPKRFQTQVKKAEENLKIKKQKEYEAYLASLPKLCQNDGVDTSWINKVNQTLTCVPKSILEGFQNRGWRMYCTTKNLDSTFFGGQFGAVMGCTDYDTHTIWLEDRQDAVTEGPVHELGHYVDYTLGWASHTAEFNRIFQNEQATFRNAYGVPGYFNNEELFAEAFWRYYISNNMASVTPGLHDYLTKSIARL